MVKTPTTVGDAGWILVGELRSLMLLGGAKINKIENFFKKGSKQTNRSKIENCGERYISNQQRLIVFGARVCVCVCVCGHALWRMKSLFPPVTPAMEAWSLNHCYAREVPGAF